MVSLPVDWCLDSYINLSEPFSEKNNLKYRNFILYCPENTFGGKLVNSDKSNVKEVNRERNTLYWETDHKELRRVKLKAVFSPYSFYDDVSFDKKIKQNFYWYWREERIENIPESKLIIWLLSAYLMEVIQNFNESNGNYKYWSETRLEKMPDWNPTNLFPPSDLNQHQ